MTEQVAASFGKLRRLFWPIHQHEVKKFLPMLLIYSLIVFNYSMLRAAKDALVITAPQAGAAAIPFIKVWAILPMALLSTLIFTRLANRFNREKVFYTMMTGFLVFFFIFAFILYPFQHILHPHALANKMQSFLPAGFSGLIAIFRNWTFTLFYVMSELWGTMIMTVLFWGFANEVTSIKEAKRFYAILGVGANIATVLAGQMSIFLSSSLLNIKFQGQDRWGASLMLITSMIVVIGIVTIFIYRWLVHNVFRKEIVDSKPIQEEPKVKMGLRKNFAYLAKSKYLICIAVMVLAYNISLNMVEVVWKDQVHNLYPYASDYNIYMSKVLTYIGITSTLLSIFICGQVIRKWGWSMGAQLTPMILLLSGACFFAFLLFKEAGFIGSISAAFGVSPLVFCAFLGSMQNCFTRASKFTFFDVTKEISFIPLSNESKLKGKAAIDGVGSRLGKSGGAFIHQILLLSFGSVAMSTPYVAGLLLVVFLGWIIAVRSLSKQFHELSNKEEKIEIAEDIGPSTTKKTPAHA